MTPKISIIVPVYNVEKYLPKCLDSLTKQTLKEIEIILVDDGSIDGSSSICDDYSLKDVRIKVIHKNNEGVSSARNVGLEFVSGEYYMFVDSDDWLDLETCEVAYNYASQHNADCLMFSYIKEFDDHSVVNHIFDQDFFVWNAMQVSDNFHRRLYGPVDDELSKPQDADIIVTPCMQLFRTDKFKDVSFVDIREVGTFEDGLYQIVLYKECERFVYIDKPFYHYLKTNDGSITTRYKEDLFDKWQHLYDLMLNHLDEWSLPMIYKEALDNRIAIGLLGLGLNQIHSKDTLFQGGQHLKKMLKTPRYKKALGQLKISAMPVSWKVFFTLAKHRMTISLFAMLKVIEYMRKNKQ